MCRFVMYLGPAIRLSSLVTEPSHSIIHQSYKAREREEPLNGDGFGVAWYAPDLGATPAIFKSVSPAWSNQNLLNLAPMVQSECLLAHVRAATPGLPVSQLDCHPFSWDNFTFMHNGEIAAFQQARRNLRRRLNDDSYHWIDGSTDSQHLFALFTDELRRQPPTDGPAIADALETTIHQVEELTAGLRGETPSMLNLVVTDGRRAVVSRYSSDGRAPNSLYVSAGRRYSCDESGVARLDETDEKTVLIASEPLTDDDSWESVAANHLVIVDEQRRVSQRAMRAA